VKLRPRRRTFKRVSFGRWEEFTKGEEKPSNLPTKRKSEAGRSSPDLAEKKNSYLREGNCSRGGKGRQKISPPPKKCNAKRGNSVVRKGGTHAKKKRGRRKKKGKDVISLSKGGYNAKEK